MPKGGIMLSIVGALIIIMMPAQTIGTDANGSLDTVVVTAPRYEHEDAAWSGLVPTVVTTAARYHTAVQMGMMDEVVVSAPRYELEDVAWSGLMPEVVVSAPRYAIPTVLASMWPYHERPLFKWHHTIPVIEFPEENRMKN
jgi:hypothetical protein